MEIIKSCLKKSKMAQNVGPGFELITKQNVHAGQANPGDYYSEKIRQ